MSLPVKIGIINNITINGQNGIIVIQNPYISDFTLESKCIAKPDETRLIAKTNVTLDMIVDNIYYFENK